MDRWFINVIVEKDGTTLYFDCCELTAANYKCNCKTIKNEIKNINMNKQQKSCLKSILKSIRNLEFYEMFPIHISRSQYKIKVHKL